jgi:cytochrome c oxidase subunit 1
VTLVGIPQAVAVAQAGRPQETPGGLLKWLNSTDHKVIGRSYLVTSFVFFLLAGGMAILIRTQLAAPDSTFVSQHTYDELFTMHGSLMMYLFAGPFAFGGLANYMIPLQVGAPDMAFPRLNALSYWLYLSGGLTIVSGFFVAGGAADFGWVAYAPLSDAVNSPGAGPDMWIVGLVLTGFSAIFTGVNILTTVFYLRAPGMTMSRLPIFTWDMIVTSVLILIAFPVLTSALVMLWCDRHLGTHIFSVAGGGVPVLWQNLFWFFGHPEVYILVLPFFGVVTEVIAVFSRKPVFGYPGMIFATVAIGALSTAVWAHHMFTTGTVLLPFFSLMSYLIAVPTGIKYFNWIGTMWRGSVSYQTPMLFAVGFLIVFLFGGVTGILVAAPPIDFATHDTYFVVAHFHQVLAGSAEFAGFSGIYYWYPKVTGRFLRERLGKLSFWCLFVGFLVTFMPQYLLGLRGMPRRIAEYSSSTGWTPLNQVSTAGAYLLFVAVALTVVNFYVAWRRPEPAPANPWDGHTLEWATSSPPPEHNFNAIPPIRSERPVWDANHPQSAGRAWAEDFASRAAVDPRRPQLSPAPGRQPDAGLSDDEVGPDVISLLVSEHLRIRAELAALVDSDIRANRRSRYAALSRVITQHDVAEAEIVFPLLGNSLGGPDIRTRVLGQEREIAVLLARTLRRMSWRSGGRATSRLLVELSIALDQHFEVEENVVFPMLARVADEPKRQLMGLWAERAERFAPTRPHPHAPRNLPGLVVVASAISVIDRVRGHVRNVVWPR